MCGRRSRCSKGRRGRLRRSDQTLGMRFVGLFVSWPIMVQWQTVFEIGQHLTIDLSSLEVLSSIPDSFMDRAMVNTGAKEKMV